MSTFVPTAGRIERRWHVIDAAEHPVGRVASLAAHLLQGKHNGSTPRTSTRGITSSSSTSSKAKLTGRKEEQKLYRYHSGYDGGLREERAKDVRARHPRRLMEEAVRGMLPKSKMGDAMYRKLNVYEGARSSARGPEAGRDRSGEVRHQTWQ